VWRLRKTPPLVSFLVGWLVGYGVFFFRRVRRVRASGRDGCVQCEVRVSRELSAKWTLCWLVWGDGVIRVFRRDDGNNYYWREAHL
jgi:hypothetical protein